MSKFKIGDRVYYLDGHNKIEGVIETIEGGVKIWAKWGGKETLGWMYESELFLLSPTTFEIGKTYTLAASKSLKCVYQDGDYFVFIGELATSNKPKFAVIHHKNMFDFAKEVKPEDWRCLHYKNNIASLGGESFSSKKEVEKKFSSSPNFIKAVRVDA